MTRDLLEVAVYEYSSFTADVVRGNPDYFRRILASAPDRETARNQLSDAIANKAQRIIELGSKSEVVYNFAAYGFDNWTQDYLEDDVDAIIEESYVAPRSGPAGSKSVRRSPAKRKTPAKKAASGRR